MASYIALMSSIFIFVSALIKGTLPIRVTTAERVMIPLGGTGTLPCEFDTPSYWAVYWQRDYDGQFGVVVSRINGRLSGAGLDSGDFNISEDNSLVINYMHLDYEATYMCKVLDDNFNDDSSTTEVITTVKPEAAPTITWDCDDQCISEHITDNVLNLTCTSDEAKPALTLTWLNDKGTPIEATSRNDTQKGSTLKGTFITTSTITYTVKRNNTLTCQAENEVIGRRHEGQKAEVKVYETVTPSAPPTISSSCINLCRSGIQFGTVINMTCASAEARPPVTLTWLDSQGTPIEPLHNNIEKGSLTGTFVTSSTIQFNFTVNTSLVCRTEMVGKRKLGLLISTIEVNEDGIGAIAHKGSFNAAATESGPENDEGANVVTILMVAVSVAVGVVIILGIIVAVLYKKNKEYIDAISYSYCLSKDGYILFARSQFAQSQNAKL